MKPLFLLALVCASTASAQPLTITPNPFDASGTAPLVFRNDTAAPVTFDSLRFEGSGGYSPVGWYIRYLRGTPDAPVYGTLYCPIQFPPRGGGQRPACYDGFGDLYGGALAPGEQVVFEQMSLKCGKCLDAGGIDDTMSVYTDGSLTPQPVTILNGGFVAADAGPDEASRRITVSPNPAARIVRIETLEAARVTVSDALGRRVAVFADVSAGEFAVDVSAWPPGVYVVRAESPSGVISARLVVAR